MTLNGVMTADARYLCGSWARCFYFDVEWWRKLAICQRPNKENV